MDFHKLIERDFVLLDGAMGTMLQQKGMPAGTIPETLNITQPDWIRDIHRQYIEAGADILYTNTFGANCKKLAGTAYTAPQLIKGAVSLAKEASAGTDVLAALDIGPIGQLLEPNGSLHFEEAYDIFAEMIRAGAQAGADLIVLETMTDLYEMRAALLAAKEQCSLPVICTMTFEENGRTFTGTSIEAMAVSLSALGADAVGINCSLGPAEIGALAKELLGRLPVLAAVKPNAGLPDPESGAYSVGPEEFAVHMKKIAASGVKFLGGCCGTTPDHIRAIREAVKGMSFTRKMPQKQFCVCSSTRVVDVDRVRVIGERINPTGKKRFKEALVNRDIDYILTQGLEQCRAGADILDVNVGHPEIDEPEMMATVIKALQSVVDAPLQIDSSDKKAVEAALRVYNGKPIVNSVNGEDEVLDTVLPLIKKYGAAVVGLTLDRGGIKKSAEERFRIAEKIVNRALFYGIPKEDICIDCLTLTASAEQEAAMETVRAVSMVKERLGVKTVLGVSNISFGLPNRALINRTFLTLAIGAGLDLPIMNPNNEDMMGAVRACALLSCDDLHADEYVRAYADIVPAQPKPSVQGGGITLFEAVKNGLKGEAARITEQLLASCDPMEVVNTMLIPPLDEAGVLFEQGKLFLPQLIQCAGAAQAAFEVIKTKIAASGGASVSRGKIILATVKGDIHDIGKNIVKVLLENYGFTVIDLGKDVDPELIVDTAIRLEVPLVGLSALMTTTLKSMAQTIALLRERKVPCKILCGGAVLTPEYAEQIGADFYAKDAKESVDIAKRVFGV